MRGPDGVLTSVDFANATLANTDFRRADLRGSVLTAFDPRVVDLGDAIITADQAVDLAESLGLSIRN
ncbi:pentapeptide repeat-containing protein [Dactylosporangium sp. NPDC005572]|uniref:pentapeptide repeat-containing protein n=1 Tax=Dactylosporangium sp. NPDC005572 TaxID=3156889 RepID=UPI00339E0018